MATGNFYRGTSATQDARFSNKDKKLLKQFNWPSEYSQKIDMKKVDLAVIKTWVQRKIVDILGEEDEVVVNFIVSTLENPGEKGIDPKKMQLDLTGFLEKNASRFMKDLWNVLLDAQSSINGIPSSLIAERKEDILSRQKELMEKVSKFENIKNYLSNEPTKLEKDQESNISKLANMIKKNKGKERDGDKAEERDKIGQVVQKQIINSEDNPQKENIIRNRIEKSPKQKKIEENLRELTKRSNEDKTRDIRTKNMSGKKADKYKHEKSELKYDKDKRRKRRSRRSSSSWSSRSSNSESESLSRSRSRDRDRDRERDRNRRSKGYKHYRYRDKSLDKTKKDKLRKNDEKTKSETKPQKIELSSDSESVTSESDDSDESSLE